MSRWYDSEEAEEVLHAWHERYSRPPSDLKLARRRYLEVVEELKYHLKAERKLVKRVDCIGSAYEGLCVQGEDVQFEAQLVLEHGDALRKHKDPVWPAYSLLTPKKHDVSMVQVLQRGNVSPEMVASALHDELEDWMAKRARGKPELLGEVQLSIQGWDLRIEVCHLDPSSWEDESQDADEATLTDEPEAPCRPEDLPGDNEAGQVWRPTDKPWKHWFDISLIPAYELSNEGKKELYVARPRDGSDMTWRRSYSTEETARLIQIDTPDHGCRKAVVRLLSALRDKDEALAALDTFHLRAALIRLCDEQVRQDWRSQSLGPRTRDMMRYLGDAMCEGILVHPYDKKVNLLHGVTPALRLTVGNRLKKIAGSSQMARLVFDVPQETS